MLLGKDGAVLTIVSILAATVLTAGQAHRQVSAMLRDRVEDSSSAVIANAQASIKDVATRVARNG